MLKLYFVSIISMLMVGCVDEGQVLLEVDLDPQMWREAAEFSFQNRGTLDERDMTLFVRFQPSLKRVDSLPLHVVTIAPDRATVVEQFTFYFDNGLKYRWRRRLYGEELYRRRVRLSQSGEYKMLIYPQRPTTGVESVGVELK